ncbi:UNVERIFIED_CONTAM: hypothetical protein Sangu_0137300 [Sesamum angustifolium]|uniref:Uncharacterized protein n=1 Tax=Sesamum angustifolium TaxID=2727405 RepID=A0AAW2RK55_9LAMI
MTKWFLIISDLNSTFFPRDCNQQEFIIAWVPTLELTWKLRNGPFYGKEAQPQEVIARIIHKNTTKYVDARVSMKVCSIDNCVSSPPPLGWIKINIDIALKDNNCVVVVLLEAINVDRSLSKQKRYAFLMPILLSYVLSELQLKESSIVILEMSFLSRT